MWNECERGDWLLWLCQKANLNKRQLTLAKGKIAETVKHLMKDERNINAVDVAIRYGYNEATEEELSASASAAYASANASAASAYAADASASASANASAASASANAASASAYASAASAYASAASAYASASAYAAAKIASLKRSAEIVREIVPFETILNLLQS
jgi:hypothetical protein